jgi:hypothetical protein
MNIAKNGSYLLETFPSQYFSITASSVAPKESRNSKVARRSSPAITALITPRGAATCRRDADDCPLSGTRVVIVISFCLFVQQGAAQVYVQRGMPKVKKAYCSDPNHANGASPLAD